MDKIIPLNPAPARKKELSLLTVWLKLLRLHTLPLSVSAVGLGNILAYRHGIFSPTVAVLSLITAVFLQILGNLANDYGDAVHHADDLRQDRLFADKTVSAKQLITAIVIAVALCIVSGSLLIVRANVKPLFFYFLGALSIVGAIAYTVGKKPYGYNGLGDLAVFLFFGVTAVCGAFCLQTGTPENFVILPTISMGLWCVCVLNINNMRDIKNDALVGKKTMAVYLGLHRAKIYHVCLLTTALCCWTIFALSMFCRLSVFLALVFTVIQYFYLHKTKNNSYFWTVSLKSTVLGIAFVTMALFLP